MTCEEWDAMEANAVEVGLDYTPASQLLAQMKHQWECERCRGVKDRRAAELFARMTDDQIHAAVNLALRNLPKVTAAALVDEEAT